jgi:hypothetical protein
MHRWYILLVSSKLEYAFVVWNSITQCTLSDVNMLERCHQKFAALYFNRFFPQFCYFYLLLWRSSHCTLYVWRGISSMHSFLFKFTLVLNFALPSLRWLVFDSPLGTSETALFKVFVSCKNCPSSRCAPTANIVCRDADVFGTKNVPLTYITHILLNIMVLTSY